MLYLFGVGVGNKCREIQIRHGDRLLTHHLLPTCPQQRGQQPWSGKQALGIESWFSTWVTGVQLLVPSIGYIPDVHSHMEWGAWVGYQTPLAMTGDKGFWTDVLTSGPKVHPSCEFSKEVQGNKGNIVVFLDLYLPIGCTEFVLFILMRNLK